jgi:hypothetical protein
MQADAATKCTGLNKPKLAAMMLAPTWEEAAAGDPANAPSPMAMSRGDTNSSDGTTNNPIYSFNTVADRPRAFWHAGVGMWQLDDAGLGAFLSANQRINASTSAKKAADTMASLYCNASGTQAQRRAAAWGPWNACNDGSCEATYQHLYCAASNTVCNITTTTAVGNAGGMKVRTCRYEGDITTNFTCWYVDIVNAQGATAGWKFDPKTGNFPSTSPLAFNFYTWAKTSTDPDKEVRTWIVDDTGYTTRGEIKARRNDGANSRDGLQWIDVTSPFRLCDTDARRGVCA